MLFRFRQSFKLAPGIRLNLSDSGLSWTLGPRGSSVSVGKSGVHLNLGLTGTGLSARIPLFKTTDNPASREDVTVQIHVSDHGEVEYRYPDGSIPSPDVITLLKQQHRSILIHRLEECCEALNRSTSNLEKIHLETPGPAETPSNWRKIFAEPQPEKPVASVSSGQDKESLANAISAYEEAMNDWSIRRDEFDDQEKIRQNLTYRALSGEPEAMERFLNGQLAMIEWPLELDVSLEVNADGKTISIDVHCAGIGAIPASQAVLDHQRLAVQLKPMTITQRQKMMAGFIHSAMFRVIGESFRCLPTLQRVVCSSYLPNTNTVIDVPEDHCVCSVSIERSKWSLIDFSRLDFLNVVDVFTIFDLRREMTKTGKFGVVIPQSA